jgi:hypothetical protein
MEMKNMKNRLLGIFAFMINGGGPPTYRWVRVQSPDYSTQNEVKLKYGNILQIHRVRCVKTSPSAPEPWVQMWCSFGPEAGLPPGEGKVTEYWQTKDPVKKDGDWAWEVELKPGEPEVEAKFTKK